MNTKTHISLPSKDVFRRVGTSIWNPQLILGILCLISVLGLLWFSISQMNQAYRSFGPAAVPGQGQTTLAVAAVLFAIALFILSSNGFRRKYGLVVNKEGLTFYRPFFAEVFIPWVSVHGIAFAQEQSRLVADQRGSRAFLWLDENQHVSLNKYVHPRDLPDVVTRIKAELYPQLEIRLRNMLQAGQDVSFGPLSLNKNGLGWQSQSLPWNQINQIILENGLLEILLEKKKAIRVNILDIPNLEIMIHLAREFEKK